MSIFTCFLTYPRPAKRSDNFVIEFPPLARKADAFVQHYAAVSRHKSSREDRELERSVKVRLSQSRRSERTEEVGPECADFSMAELSVALKAGKAKGAEGSDVIAPLFLCNLGEASREFVLACFNQS